MNHSSIISEAKTVLIQLVKMIHQLTFDEYTEKISLLSNSTIGEHTRHIIELYQQLLNGYDAGQVNYDNRERNFKIQQNIDFAAECTANVIANLEKADKQLFLHTVYNNHETDMQSNYFRELMYNTEHCIHHQAIIKIALLHLGKTEIGDNFGVAKSTIIYRKKCVQ